MRLVEYVQRDPGARLLVVTSSWPSPEKPAYGVFIQRQVESLCALGVRCDVLRIHGDWSVAAYLRTAAHLLRLSLARRRYRLVHAHGGEAGVAARFYLGAPLLISYCGADILPPRDGAPGRERLVHRLRQLIVRTFSHFADATITKSAEMAACLPKRVRARNLVVPNGVDRSLFAPAPREEARRSLGWGADERVVLFAADPAVRRKRFPLARAACEHAAEILGGRIRLHVAAGTPPDRMPQLMNAADCLLLTSASEGSPNVVKEALACDLPVVSTRVGDVAEQLAGVRPSFVCGDASEELAVVLVACLTDRSRSNGRERSEHLAAEAIARRVLSIYDRLDPPRAVRRRVAEAIRS